MATYSVGLVYTSGISGKTNLVRFVVRQLVAKISFQFMNMDTKNATQEIKYHQDPLVNGQSRPTNQIQMFGQWALASAREVSMYHLDSAHCNNI